MSTPSPSMRARVSQAVYERSAPASAIIPLSIQPYLAAIFISAFAVSAGLGLTNKSSCSYIYTFLAALTLSFGAVFVVNSVRVYTG